MSNNGEWWTIDPWINVQEEEKETKDKWDGTRATRT